MAQTCSCRSVETSSGERCGPLNDLGVLRGGVHKVAAADRPHFDREARRLETLLPHGPRIAVLGSTDFWHAESERTCCEIGRLLAGIPGLVLLTGGVQGIGEAVGRDFFQTRRHAGEPPCIYHVLPEGEEAWDYGETLFAGADMTERREVLGRLSRVFLMVEGGPGAGHEAGVAIAEGALVIPVGRSGGYAATLHARMSRPATIDAVMWVVLGSSASTPEETARAAVRAVQSCL
jgi:SLOG cluster4 family